jgi:hypothetical protein
LVSKHTNFTLTVSIEWRPVTINDPKALENPPYETRFFEKVDWLSFGLTTLLALTVYLLTLAPDVTLEYSGVFSTAAMYPSPSIPSGHPLWAVYGWLFTKIIPFYNIAWRLNMASAVAGALTCGLIALRGLEIRTRSGSEPVPSGEGGLTVVVQLPSGIYCEINRKKAPLFVVKRVIWFWSLVRFGIGTFVNVIQFVVPKSKFSCRTKFVKEAGHERTIWSGYSCH